MITRLFEEVWARDRCAGCGMCLAACSKQVIVWDPNSTAPMRKRLIKAIGPSRFELDTCSFCEQFCEAVCPRLEPAARLQPVWQGLARTSTGGEPNEVVRNLLIAARGAGLIDGALMTDVDRDGATRARIVTSAGEIAETVGFQLVWTPVLDALNQAVFDLGLKRLAIVATPCTAEAVRRLLDAPVARLAPYRQAIVLNIAMFCTGVFQPDELRKMLADKLHVAPAAVRRITASPRTGRLRAQLWDGAAYEMDLAEAEAYTRPGCARCDDYLGESADLAVGTAGAREGFSTVIARTPAAQAAVQNAVTMKLLETAEGVDAEALERAVAHKDRRERAQAFDELEVLMLDALLDPRKRAEVKQKFDALYGGARPITRREDYRYAGCGDCSGC